MNAFLKKVPGRGVVMTVENARVLGGGWSDFSGHSTDFSTGRQHFKIEVEESCVDTLKSWGFDVKWYQKDENYPGMYFLDINLSWKFGDPIVYVVTNSNVRVQQTQQSIGDLDGNRNIDYADMDLSASHWEYMGKSGTKPYASNLYIYLGAPSNSEQRYMERCGNNVYQPQLPNMPEQAAVSVDEDDIPF